MKPVISRVAFAAAVIGAMIAAGNASAQSGKSKRAAVESSDVPVRRSVFSGNEVQLAVLNWVNPDCSPTRPDVRVSKQPSHGDLAFKEVRTVVELKTGSPRAHCNGKPTTGIGVFYTSREDFNGEEKLALDVDYQTGFVQRYSITVDVR
jgi:hypothetical protein